MWYESQKSQQWIKSHPSVDNWLTRLGSDETRSTYGQCLQAFCEWSGMTTGQLLDMNRQDSEATNHEKKYRSLVGETDQRILAYLIKQGWPVTTEMVVKDLRVSRNTVQVHRRRFRDPSS